VAEEYVGAPEVPAQYATIPDIPVWESELPGTSVFYVPGAWIPVEPSSVAVSFTTEATLSVVISGRIPRDANQTITATLSVDVVAKAPVTAGATATATLTASTKIPLSAAMTAIGTLAATIKLPVSAPFTAGASLSAAVIGGFSRTADFASTATLSAAVTAKATAVAAFTASGQLAAAAQAEGGTFAVTAPFTASGSLSGAVVEREKATAGFTASGTGSAAIVPREFRTAAFTAAGALSAVAKEAEFILAEFTTFVDATAAIGVAVAAPFTSDVVFSTGILANGGSIVVDAPPFTATGTLSATTVEAEGVIAPFTAAGALSATVVEREIVTANFTATVDVFLQVAEGEKVAVGFNAQVSLSAAVSIREYRTAAFTGAGTLSAATVEREIVAAGFTGTGTLSADAVIGGLKDDFNRANGSAEVAPWLRRMSWSGESFVISSNTLKRNSGGAADGLDGTDGMIYTDRTTITDDQFAQVTVTTLGGAPGPGVILGADVAGTSSVLWAELFTTGWRIFTAVPTSGSKTILASGSGTFTAGSTLRLEKSGNSARLYYGGVYLGGYNGGVTTLPTGRYAGVRPGSASSAVDDWEAGDLVTRSHGMAKSGTQVAGTTAWFQITGFTSKPGWTNGPTSNALVATATGAVIIQAQVDFSGASGSKQIRVKQNSTVLYTLPVTTSTSAVPIIVHANAVAGDVFTLEAINSVSPTIGTPTFMTMRPEEFVFLTTHSDNFDRANGNLDATAPWDQPSVLAKPVVNTNQVNGSGDPNCRGFYETSPASSRTGQFFKVDVAAINSRVGVVFNASTGAGSSWAVLTNSTTLLVGFTSSTTSSNAGTTYSTITVPTVTPPKEMLVMLTSDTTVDIFIDRVYVATQALADLHGVYGGLYVQTTTDKVDNYAQGVWA
jgi:hypothetical protein